MWADVGHIGDQNHVTQRIDLPLAIQYQVHLGWRGSRQRCQEIAYLCKATVLDIKLVPEEYAVIDNNLISDNILTFPNPLAGNIVRFESAIPVKEIRIFSCSGIEIKDFIINPDSGEIHLETLPHGLYLIRFETTIGTGIKKLVVNQ